MLRYCAIALACLASAPAAQAATLNGTTLSFFHEFNGFEFDNQQTVVGPGVEFTRAAYDVDINGNLLTVNFKFALGNGTGFNGAVIRDVLGTIPTFVSAVLVKDSFGGGAVATVADDELRLDFSSSTESAGDFATFRVALAPVPVPATLPLLAAGLGALVYAGRRRKAAA